VSFEIFVVAYAAVLGLIVGSYLNVVIYRLPRRMSTVLPRSRCPACGAPIGARDNLPVVSWLLLGGRCRACRAPISPRYPLIEAATAALFVGCVLCFQVTIAALAAALFGAVLIALAAIDVEHLLLPDRLTLPGIVIGLALSPFLPFGGLRSALLGAALGAGVLLAISGGWLLLRGEEGMGLGDVKMLAMIGAFLGWKGMVVTLFSASLLGALVGVVLLGRSRAGLKTKLPFGAFLSLGGLFALFAGAPLVDLYLRLL
jgi:leader peptidase (prepilin peptidase)/N-methyltransferase